MELSEILQALKEHVGDDKAKAKAVAKALHDAVPSIGQALIDKGAGLKQGEVQDKLKEAQDKLKEKEDELKTLTEEFEEFKKKTPDAAIVEAKAKEKWEVKVKTAQDELKATKDKLKEKMVDLQISAFVATLASEHHVDPDYAREVLGSQYRNRFVPKDDFSVDVLALGETSPLQPTGDKSAVQLLAGEVIKKVKPVYILAEGEGGGGITEPTNIKSPKAPAAEPMEQKIIAGQGVYGL